jgi:hypothetical protein
LGFCKSPALASSGVPSSTLSLKMSLMAVGEANPYNRPEISQTMGARSRTSRMTGHQSASHDRSETSSVELKLSK